MSKQGICFRLEFPKEIIMIYSSSLTHVVAIGHKSASMKSVLHLSVCLSVRPRSLNHILKSIWSSMFELDIWVHT